MLLRRFSGLSESSITLQKKVNYHNRRNFCVVPVDVDVIADFRGSSERDVLLRQLPIEFGFEAFLEDIKFEMFELVELILDVLSAC